MTYRRIGQFIVAAALIAAAIAAPAAQSTTTRQLEATLQAGIRLETVNGDCKGAIEQYKKVADGGDRSLAARAILRMAGCSEKLGDPQARQLYERIIQTYADQIIEVGEAQTRLEALGARRSTGAMVTPDAVVVCSGVDCPGLSSLSRDGRWAAMVVGSRDGSLELRDMTTGETRRLVTASGGWGWGVQRTRISPDGRNVAYTWIDGEAYRYTLRIVGIDPNSQPRRLVDDPNVEWVEPLAWSTDGRRVLAGIFKRNGLGELVWISITDGAQALVPTGSPALSIGMADVSPDGRLIAYVAPHNTKNQIEPKHIYILATDGKSQPIQATQGQALDDYPVWSADGQHLLFRRTAGTTADLLALPVRDGHPAGAPFVVKPDVGDLRPIGVTSDGHFYYVERRQNSREVRLLELETTGVLPAVPHEIDRLANAGKPSWSPDGTQVAFERISTTLDDRAQIVVHPVTGGRDRTFELAVGSLPRDRDGVGRAASRPIWLPDGGLIQRFIVSEDNGSRQGRLDWFKLDPTRGEYEPLPTLSSTPSGSSLSSDGRTLYRIRGRQGGLRMLVAVNLATGDERSVLQLPTAMAGELMGPLLSPDGRSLAWAVSNTATTMATVSVDGTGYREVGRSPETEPPLDRLAWTRDSRYLLYPVISRSGACRLMRIAVAGGASEFTGLELPTTGGFCQIAASAKQPRVAVSVAAERSDLVRLDVSAETLAKKAK